MKPLIPLDSPKYLRRIVRALNAEAMTGNGFYCQLESGWRFKGSNARLFRCNRAKLDGLAIFVRVPNTDSFEEAHLESFCDCNGRSIVASRQA